MDESKPAPPRNSSRTLAIALVAVLIVVAIAGIVLAGLRGRATGPAPAPLPSATQPGERAPTAAAATSAPAVAAEAGAAANQVAFASASDTLSPSSLKKIADMAQAATKANNSVTIVARLEAGSEREKRMELAKKRADAVRRAFQAGGVSVNAIKVQISELPPGLVTPIDADRIELSLK